MDQESRRVALLERNETILRRAAPYVFRSPEELSWQPAGGGWPIGTVFEHLCVANGLYLVKLAELLATTDLMDAEEAAEWKPSLGGGLLVRSMEAKSKLRAPRVFAPAPQPRTDVVREFIGQHEQLSVFLAASSRVRWQRMRLASPVTWLLRMNLGDTFGVLVAHAERHLRQVDRVAEEMDPSVAPH